MECVRNVLRLLKKSVNTARTLIVDNIGNLPVGAVYGKAV